MFTKIMLNTPFWVWILLAALLALGYSQTSSRSIGLRRLVIISVAMIVLSLYGTVSAFGPSPLVLGAWLAACAVVVSLVVLRPAPKGTAYDGLRGSYTLPGSWLPLFITLGIFCTKYAVGVTLAMHPSMAGHTLFAVLVSMLYGLFSGFFAGRALRLWRLALPFAAH
jgi:fucose 4-O-acetylase-like acetyltransferase